MFCRKCGKELAKDSQFCTSCGTEIEVPSTNVVPEPRPEQVTQPQVTQAPVYQAVAKNKSNAPLIIGVVVGVVVLILLLVFLLAVPVYLNSQKNAKKRTCQANLRTIDGAINVYMADLEKNPDSVGAIFQAGYLRKIPKCPSGDLPYKLRGDPPEAYCPNDPSHTL